MDIVAFARVIQGEFGIKFNAENCAELQTLGQPVDFLNANAG